MILVTGAAGTVGSEAVRLLSARRQPTRALVRDPSRAAHHRDLADEIEIVTGDFDRPDTLDAALRGVDTVVLVSPAVPAHHRAHRGLRLSQVRIGETSNLGYASARPRIWDSAA